MKDSADKNKDAGSDSADQKKQPGYGPYGVPYYGYGYGYGYGVYDSQSDGGFLGSFSLRRLVRVVRKRWLTILAAILFSGAAGVFKVAVTDKVYRAESQIEMYLRKPRVLTQEGAVVDDSLVDPSEVYNTLLAKFKGTAMLQTAVGRFRDIRGDEKSSDAALRSMIAGHAEFKQLGKTQLVRILFEHSDPQVAADGANAFAQAAEASAIEENRKRSDSAVAWLQGQASALREDLSRAEQALVEFRVSNNMDRLEGKKRSAEGSLSALTESLIAIEGQEILVGETFDFLTKMELDPENAGALPPGMPRQDQIRNLLRELQATVRERDALSKRYRPKHPEMKALEAEIVSLRDQFRDEITTARQAISNNLSLIRQQIESLRIKAAEQRELAAQADLETVELNAKLSSLQRERDARDIAYRGILDRIEKGRLSADDNTAIIKILETARIPSSPIKPDRTKIMTVALLLGLVVGGWLALLVDTLEDHVTSFADIEKGMGLKVLGLMPHMTDMTRDEIAVVNMSDKFSQLSESVAGIRSILDSSQYHEVARSILVASSVPEEGKTITACNLAITSARSGTKTLLVDFDLRRPRMGRIFKIPDDKASLLHVLASGDTSAFETLPYKESCKNLHIVTSRTSEFITPSEVVGGKAVREFMAWAKKNYERIVIDSPPFGIVNDSAVLAGQVGCVIMVCRPERSRKKATRHAVRQFAEVGANVIGVVVNDVDFSKGIYFSNYDYYQSHYNYKNRYYYGPGMDPEDKKSRKKRRGRRKEASGKA